MGGGQGGLGLLWQQIQRTAPLRRRKKNETMCGHQGAGALTPPGFSTDAESQREADLAYLVPRATTAPSPVCICRVKKTDTEIKKQEEAIIKQMCK